MLSAFDILPNHNFTLAWVPTLYHPSFTFGRYILTFLLNAQYSIFRAIKFCLIMQNAEVCTIKFRLLRKPGEFRAIKFRINTQDKIKLRNTCGMRLDIKTPWRWNLIPSTRFLFVYFCVYILYTHIPIYMYILYTEQQMV